MKTFFLGFGICVLLRDSGKSSIKLSQKVGPKTMHIGMSLLFTLPIENLKISFTFTIFYVVEFLKLTAMMIEVAYVIPWVLSRIKAEDL